MRARSIAIASLLFAIAVLPGIGFALEAVSRHQVASGPLTEATHKADVLPEIDLQTIDIRLASLEPRDVLQDRGGLSSVGARTAANFAASGLPAQQATLIAPTPRLSSQPRSHDASDYWLMGLVAVMLVAYQLRRKHRFLRPQPFNS
ncbi:MAG TPA: hypothetical protein VNQ81_14910 [Povalibacter sp.]|nr:hypothetical protein [Povalibacter sp.]